MSLNMGEAQLVQLQSFISVLKSDPTILHTPELAFFKKFIEGFGAVIPPPSEKPETAQGNNEQPESEQAKTSAKLSDSEPEENDETESEVELDTSEVIEPDHDEPQFMGDDTVEVTDEASDKVDELRGKAMSELSDGNHSEAISLLTEAIKLDPHSAVLFAKRASTFLKLKKPNAAKRDCDKALTLNPDSAAAYRFRGRAHMLLGEWEEAVRDLSTSCKIDFDIQTDEWLRIAQPNAKKLSEHRRKQERKQEERELNARQARIKKAKEENEKAAREEQARRSAEENFNGMPSGTGGMPGGAGGMPSGPGGMPGAGGMPNLGNLFQDPEIMQAFQDPEVAAAFQDISKNPANFSKYQGNPKITKIIEKMSQKMGGAPGGGMPGGFPMGGMPGGFPM